MSSCDSNWIDCVMISKTGRLRIGILDIFIPSDGTDHVDFMDVDSTIAELGDESLQDCPQQQIIHCHECSRNSSENHRLLDENRKQQEVIASLAYKIEMLSSDNERLQQESDDVRRDNASLKCHIEHLMGQAEQAEISCKEKFDEMERQLEASSRQREELQDQSNSLHCKITKMETIHQAQVREAQRVAQQRCREFAREKRGTQESYGALQAEVSRLRNVQKLYHESREEARKLARECNASKMELGELRNAEKKCQNDLIDARKKAEDATQMHQKLFQMLQLSNIKRSDVGNQDTFPDGNMIVKKMRTCQEDAVFFYGDLVELFGASRSPIGDGDGKTEKTSCSKDYVMVLTDVLVPCYQYAERHIESFRQEKEHMLCELMEDTQTSLRQNPLVKLFMLSSMQRVVHQRTRPDKGTAVQLDPAYAKEWPNLEYASSREVEHSQDMEGRHVGSFTKSLMDLQMQCMYSDPECFLWPCVGMIVGYSPLDHDQKLLPCYNRKAKPGTMVRVLYPGLYFSTPQQSHPVVKALVIQFESEANNVVVSSEERGQNRSSSFWGWTGLITDGRTA